MMILPLADALMNCLQNLTSRIAGVDNEQMSNRVLGMGAMLSFGLGAIKDQFKTPSSNIKTDNTNNDNSNIGGFKGFVNRAKSVINPSMNLSAETDYNGNVNPIRDVLTKEKTTFSKNKDTTIKTNNKETKTNRISNVASNIATSGINATKSYLRVGANLVEGNLGNRKNVYKSSKAPLKNTEYVSQHIIQEKGEENEFKGQSKE